MNEFKSWHRAEFGEDKELDDLGKTGEIAEEEHDSEFWDRLSRELAAGKDEFDEEIEEEVDPKLWDRLSKELAAGKDEFDEEIEEEVDSELWDRLSREIAEELREDIYYRSLYAKESDNSKDLKKKKAEETEEKRDSKVENSAFKEFAVQKQKGSMDLGNYSDFDSLSAMELDEVRTLKHTEKAKLMPKDENSSTFEESNPKDTNVSEVISIEPASNEVVSQAINSVVNVLEDTNVYPKVDIQEYVKHCLEMGTLLPFTAEKFARIIARPGMIGEEVISWSEDKDGNEIKEKVATVKLDEKTNQPGWVVAKADENGVAVIDKNGHPNQWIIEDSKFRQKYEVDSVYPWLFKPTGGVQTFVELPQGITLEQWGGLMAIDAGGFINITKANDMYGISKRDFEDTYRVVQPPERPKSL